MGVTVQQLGQIMTAQEFGMHYALECEEPTPYAQQVAMAAVVAATANGPLQAPEQGRLWRATDFMRQPWQLEQEPAPAIPEPQSVEQILASAKAAGMRVQ